VGLVALGSFSIGWMSALDLEVLPRLFTQRGFGPVTFGVFFALPPLLNLLLVPHVNRLSDRAGGRRRFLLLGAAGIAGAFALMAGFAASTWILCAAALLLFLATVVFSGPYHLFLAEQSVHKGTIALANGVLDIVGLAAAFTALGAWLGAPDGHRAALWASALVVLGVAIVIVAVGQHAPRVDRRRDAQRRTRQQTVSEERRRLPTRRRFNLSAVKWFYVGLLALNLGNGAFFSFAYYHLHTTLHLVDATIAHVFLFLLGGIVVGTALLNRAARPRIAPLAWCVALMAPLFALLSLVGDTQHLEIVAVGFGVPLGGALSLPYGYITARVAARGQAHAQARFSQAGNAGSMLGALGAGALLSVLEHLGAPIALGLTVLVPAAYATAAWCLLRQHRSDRDARTQPEPTRAHVDREPEPELPDRIASP